MYDPENWNLPGWVVGASYVYALMLNRQPGKATHGWLQNRTIEESSYSSDAVYTL